MTIKDVLKSYYAPAGHTAMQHSHNQRLYRDCLNRFGLQSIELDVIAIAVKEICPKPEIHPDRLIQEILIPIGMTTGDQLIKWLEKDWTGFNAQGYADILNPSVPDLGVMREISVYEARQTIRNITGIHPFNLFEDDLVYRLIKPIMIQPTIIKNPAIRRPYVAESHDCDDFQNETVGWLSKWNYGNLIFGKRSDVMLYNKGVATYQHAITHILDDNNTLWMYDPQATHLIWKYGDVPPIENCDEIKILKMLI